MFPQLTDYDWITEHTALRTRYPGEIVCLRRVFILSYGVESTLLLVLVPTPHSVLVVAPAFGPDGPRPCTKCNAVRAVYGTV